MSSHSIHSTEKYSHSPEYPSQQQGEVSSPSLFLNILRLGQYLISIPTLIVGVLAIDRSLVSQKWFSDEGLIIAATSIALLLIPLTTHLTYTHNSHRRSNTLTSIVDLSISILLLSSIILVAINQSHSKGSCLGPAKIGVFDNLRACRKMKNAAILAGIDFVLFGTSAIVGFFRR